VLALRVDLLAGRYAATEYNDRETAEWPPHPARLFSALVATWADGQPGTEEGDAELAALHWLETQPAPVIVASARDHAGLRPAVTVFVPVNDVGVISHPDRAKLDEIDRQISEVKDPAARVKLEKQRTKLADKLATDTAKEVAAPKKVGKHDPAAADHALLDRRVRQPRTFPSAAPEVPAFAFVWNEAEAAVDVVAALARLASRLVRLGHSSSMVHARLVDSAEIVGLAATASKYIPDEDSGRLVVRWVASGQVERLCRAHARHREVEPRVLPSTFVRYREGARIVGTVPPHSVFDPELLVFEREAIMGSPDAAMDSDAHGRESRRPPVVLTSASAAGLARMMRAALMSVSDQPVPEVLSGHTLGGAPTERPHVAIVPLPAVIGRYADGALLGLAIVLPRGLDATERRALMRAIGLLEEHAARSFGAAGADRASTGDSRPRIVLNLGASGQLILRRDAWQEATRSTVRQETWTRPSRGWASATPVALDRNPGDLHAASPEARAAAFSAAQASVVEAVARIGLPPPIEVDVVRSCVLPGTIKPRAFPRFPIDHGKSQRVLVHVRLVFAQPVQGPVLIGAGRYQGLGLCLPVELRSEAT
jgi:CRISPR-associated protein Csb2